MNLRHEGRPRTPTFCVQKRGGKARPPRGARGLEPRTTLGRPGRTPAWDRSPSAAFTPPAKAAHASARPCSMAALISGEGLFGSKLFPAPTPILAKRAMNAFSVGSVGQNCSTKYHDVGAVQRGLLSFGAERLDEINGRRAFGCGRVHERRQRLDFVTRLTFSRCRCRRD